MLTLDEIESGLLVTHKNTGLRYSVVEFEDEEVLLSPEQEGLQDLTAVNSLRRNASARPLVRVVVDEAVVADDELRRRDPAHRRRRVGRRARARSRRWFATEALASFAVMTARKFSSTAPV
jgi:hypothetical protein